jgi:transcriptional accessory protein Tex/SPT6
MAIDPQHANRKPRYPSQVKPRNFVDDTWGLPTVVYILNELETGRDPRAVFKAAVFTYAAREREESGSGKTKSYSCVASEARLDCAR